MLRPKNLVLISVALCFLMSGSLASAHNISSAESNGPSAGRLPGQPDFTRVGQTEVEYRPHLGQYVVRRKNGPAYFAHVDLDPTPVELAFGPRVELPGIELRPTCRNSGNRVVAVYTHRSADTSPTPTTTIRTVLRRMAWKFYAQSALSSEGSRALSLAVDCTPGGTINVYDVATKEANFSSISSEVPAQLFGSPTGTSAVKYLVFEHDSGGTASGIAGIYSDSTKSTSNFNASLTLTAIAFGESWTSHVPVHELVHTFGGAQGKASPPAPFSTPGFHCTDGIDALCYEDETSATSYSDTKCSSAAGFEQPTAVPIDCGYDTYFDALPAAGSWLSTYWNVGGTENLFLPAMSLTGDSAGIWRGSEAKWYLRNSNTPGGSTSFTPFAFGVSGTEWDDRPIAGDWDGDGDDTIGVWRRAEAKFYLRNSNWAGSPDITPFAFGVSSPEAGDIAVAGDWDGDGDDTVGVWRASEGRWYLLNSNSAGSPDRVFDFGVSNPTFRDQPVPGNWDGV